MSTHDRHSWLGRITQAGQVRIRRWMIARRGWPMPGDFDAMSADEFDAFVDRIGFDARIKQAIAQADTEAETPTHRRLPVR